MDQLESLATFLLDTDGPQQMFYGAVNFAGETLAPLAVGYGAFRSIYGGSRFSGGQHQEHMGPTYDDFISKGELDNPFFITDPIQSPSSSRPTMGKITYRNTRKRVSYGKRPYRKRAYMKKKVTVGTPSFDKAVVRAVAKREYVEWTTFVFVNAPTIDTATGASGIPMIQTEQKSAAATPNVAYGTRSGNSVTLKSIQMNMAFFKIAATATEILRIIVARYKGDATSVTVGPAIDTMLQDAATIQTGTLNLGIAPYMSKKAVDAELQHNYTILRDFKVTLSDGVSNYRHVKIFLNNLESIPIDYHGNATSIRRNGIYFWVITSSGATNTNYEYFLKTKYQP